VGDLVPDAMIIPLEVRRSGTDEAAALFIGKAGGFFKDLHEHLARKFAGLRVLIRGMVGSQERSPVRNFVFCAVLKQKSSSSFDQAELPQVCQVGIKSNLT